MSKALEDLLLQLFMTAQGRTSTETWAVIEAAIRADENAKATAIERERCAKVADKRVENLSVVVKDHASIDQMHTIAEAWEYALDEAREIAAAIRAGEKPSQS